MSAASEPLAVEVLRGAAILPFVPALAELRIAVFRAWPYLYDGDAAYEAEYLATYCRCDDSVLVLARAGGRVVGCSTALPLAAETANVQAPFLAAGWAPESVFYFGESVLLPEYRGAGLGHRFFDAREAAARAWLGGRAGHAAFCAVERDPADPRRPAEARSLEPFWRGRGYVRQPDMHAVMHWRDLGDSEASAHLLGFWTRALDPESPP